ncbi:MAG TPA: hypothetical protein VFF15_08225 [Flavobacteriaceae bacterium]|nr:hypothetical protein [Flavobacteriaceae bacterium]
MEVQKVDSRTCEHPIECQFTKIIEASINCETTVTQCALCDTTLTKPITDCR